MSDNTDKPNQNGHELKYDDELRRLIGCLIVKSMQAQRLCYKFLSLSSVLFHETPSCKHYSLQPTRIQQTQAVFSVSSFSFAAKLQCEARQHFMLQRSQRYIHAFKIKADLLPEAEILRGIFMIDCFKLKIQKVSSFVRNL